MSDRYLDLVLAGDALWMDIDDFVERWHQGDSSEELHEYLGLTWDEYSTWVEQPAALRLIIAARKRDEPLFAMLRDTHEHALAARGGLSELEARRVRRWLQETGRLTQD